MGVGTGLGLWTSRNLVLSLGGAIEVESTVGAGSVFRVVLPASDVEPARPEQCAPAASAVRGRVLVVDDDELVARAVQRVLEPEHDVVVEGSAARAISGSRSTGPTTSSCAT